MSHGQRRQGLQLSMWLSIQIIAAWFIADFISGIFHWIEDRYFDESHSLEFARGIATDNIVHHEDPTAMTSSTWWENMRSAAYVGWPVAWLAWYAGLPLVVWLALFFSTFGNLVHRFSHDRKTNLPRWIKGLQEFGVFISHKHHATHHFAMGHKITKATANRAYCPMTDWVNPVLDKIRFWVIAERCLAIFRIKTVA